MKYFFGPEDFDLSFRLKKYGRLVVNLDIKTFHMLTQSSKVSGWLSRSYYEAKGFLILIKKEGDLLDKLIGYSYFILRIPYYLILLALKKEKKIEFMVTVLAVMISFLTKNSKNFYGAVGET